MNRLYIVILMLVGFVSCDIADEYIVNDSQRLRFSSDTLSFDTLFSTIPSTSRTLILFNDDDKGVCINNVKLERGTESIFRVNIDGEVLDDRGLYNLKIAGGDSIFVFAEITLPEIENNVYEEHVDALLITLENGVVQRVPLVATALGAEIYDETVHITADTVFSADRIRVFRRSLVVDKGVTLQIKGGATLFFHNSSGLDVYGRLICDGDSASWVTMRCDRLDRLFDYLPYDNTAGRWEGVKLHATSFGNELRFTDIHGGKFGIMADSTDVLIDACVVHNVDGDALRLLSSKSKVVNTQLSNAHGHCAAVYGGNSDFTFVTMAQFYPWDLGRGAALHVSDHLLDIDAPVSQMLFSSCLITGYNDDVLMGDFYDVGIIPFMFRNCVIRTPQTDDATRFVDICWELAKNDSNDDYAQGQRHFKKFDTEKFLYDFAPIDSSSVRGVAYYGDAVSYPRDSRGVLRVDSICAGCYEFTRQ